jgi:NADH-quinone oxidoreductase subunit J
MMVSAFIFYLFAVTAVVAGFMVVISKNPVHSVLWLILTFLSASGLFVTLGAEFVAMLLIIVYVGAVAVLFLFVVMMLDVDFAELKGELARLMPLGLAIGVVMLLQLGMAFGNWAQADGAQALRVAPMIDGVDNTTAIGLLVYDQYLYLFQASGLILLVAMIGAILLTLRHRKDVKRQNVLSQMYRKPEDQMKLVDVKPGQGL